MAISNFIGGVLVVIVGFMMYKNMIIAFSRPFMMPVSEPVEQHLLGQKVQFELVWATTLARSIRIKAGYLMLELLISFPLLILSLISGIYLVTSALLFLNAAYFVGFGNLDFTLERHKKYAGSLKLVPVIGVLFILPLATAASTVSVVKKLGLKQ